MGKFSRRQFFWRAGAATASSILLKGCMGYSPEALNPIPPIAQTPGGRWVAKPAPETPQITLGYFPTLAAAPLIIAQEKDLFRKYGMSEVVLIEQTDWTVPPKPKFARAAAEKGWMAVNGRCRFPIYSMTVWEARIIGAFTYMF
uniref:ABC transporter substrate-binding protein n=1 Tax=Desertifilum tharense IPPAS B-1220 TaxID=1781255 RepID=A0ACD5GRD7_9CYAN